MPPLAVVAGVGTRVDTQRLPSQTQSGPAEIRGQGCDQGEDACDEGWEGLAAACASARSRAGRMPRLTLFGATISPAALTVGSAGVPDVAGGQGAV
jgi:hypothetical protein